MNNEIFGERGQARRWIKETLEVWFATKNSDSYAPFDRYFRSDLYPYEVLISIYDSLLGVSSSEDLLLSPSPTSVFRQAVAELLIEPEISQRAPEVYLELLWLGTAIGSTEVLSSITQMLESGVLPHVAFGKFNSQKEYAVLTVSVEAVLGVGYTGKQVVQFLNAAVSRIEDGSPSPRMLALEYVRHDRAHWPQHIWNLREHLNEYFDAYMFGANFFLSRDSFRDSLVTMIGEAEYSRGIDQLNTERKFRALSWLLAKDVDIGPYVAAAGKSRDMREHLIQATNDLKNESFSLAEYFMRDEADARIH